MCSNWVCFATYSIFFQINVFHVEQPSWACINFGSILAAQCWSASQPFLQFAVCDDVWNEACLLGHLKPTFVSNIAALLIGPRPNSRFHSRMACYSIRTPSRFYRVNPTPTSSFSWNAAKVASLFVPLRTRVPFHPSRLFSSRFSHLTLGLWFYDVVHTKP